MVGAQIVDIVGHKKKDKGGNVMPATTKVVRRLTGLALHHPEKVYPRNRSILRMSGTELHKYASTPEKGLPYRKKKKGVKK